MRKLIVFSLLALAAATLTVAPVASAQRDDNREILKRGKCSGASTWKLKLKFDDGRIEAEFEVDQNIVGRRWRVVLRRNGVVALRRIRRREHPVDRSRPGASCATRPDATVSSQQREHSRQARPVAAPRPSELADDGGGSDRPRELLH